MKERLKSLVPPKIYSVLSKFHFEYISTHVNSAYSQEGEDLILKRIFKNKKNGFYVDVGAHHPKRFSNTYYFYLHGWRGINIDAMPGSMKKFNKIRPNDINLEVPISNVKKKLIYYSYKEPALNGFSVELNEQRSKNHEVIAKISMGTSTLEEILNQWLPNEVIDFLSVDVEGLDFEVLKSNNWDKFRPKVVLVESLNKSCEDCLKTEMNYFMNEYGYVLFAKTFNTLFFIEFEFLSSLIKSK